MKILRQTIQRCDLQGRLLPHNIHFAMVSALMGGDGKQALAAAAKLTRRSPTWSRRWA
jgi:hypothetical protein